MQLLIQKKRLNPTENRFLQEKSNSKFIFIALDNISFKNSKHLLLRFNHEIQDLCFLEALAGSNHVVAVSRNNIALKADFIFK